MILITAVKGAEIINDENIMNMTCQNHNYYLLLHDIVKNSTSLTANWKLLLYLYISTFLVLKLALILIFLRPAGSSPGRTEVMPT